MHTIDEIMESALRVENLVTAHKLGIFSKNDADSKKQEKEESVTIEISAIKKRSNK